MLYCEQLWGNVQNYEYALRIWIMINANHFVQTL